MSDFSAVDYRPLTDPDDLPAFRSFKQWAMATKQPWAPTTGGTIIGYVVGGFLATMFSFLFGSMMGGVAGHFSGSATVGAIFSFVPAAAFLIYVVVNVLIDRRRSPVGVYWEQWYRSYHFAAANNLRWHLRSKKPNYPGSAFGFSHDTVAYEHFIAASDRYLDIGNLRYSTGSGKSRTTHEWGFMALKLDRRIPHCVVDALSNNGLFSSNMPRFDKEQRLHLEGDFDRYFTLYCPREYERDALYIFTPDLMALLIDNVSAFDVEIVDDWMFVYSTKPWDLQNPWLWHRLFTIVHTVGRKTLARTEYYRDDRAMPALPAGTLPAPPSAANNVVAPQGQRLTKRFNWAALASAAFMLLACTAVVIIAVFGTLLGS